MPCAYVSETDKDEKCLKDDKDLNFMRDTEYCDDEILVSSIEEKEEVLQPHESPEPEKVMKKGKYNLRKSLAWDNAFFTNEGKCIPNQVPFDYLPVFFSGFYVSITFAEMYSQTQVFWNPKKYPA